MLLTVVFLSTHLVVPFINPGVDDLHAYVSPGNFYEQGELSVSVVNIPDTTAPVELDVYTPSGCWHLPGCCFSAWFYRFHQGV